MTILRLEIDTSLLKAQIINKQAESDEILYQVKIWGSTGKEFEIFVTLDLFTGWQVDETMYSPNESEPEDLDEIDSPKVYRDFALLLCKNEYLEPFNPKRKEIQEWSQK